MQTDHFTFALDFRSTLRGTDKVLYTTTYEFHLKHVPGATEESAHCAGLEKLEGVKKLARATRHERH